MFSDYLLKGFQFLLVRLKVSLLAGLVASIQISIPSGTIKSVLNFSLFHVLFEISIPSGTIKRAVRYCLHLSRYVISIPSGTIKSNNAEIKKTIKEKFQFLLVRLKDLTSYTWCKQCRISIPSGTIKSYLLSKTICKVWVHFNSFWYD